jgi:hypothetical protein
MSPAEMLTLLRAKPFIPFRVVTSEGTTYEVRHPDLVMVGVAVAVIGYPDSRVQGAFERFDIVSMRHIVRLEPDPQPVEQA